jgi:hypothetical protein
MPPITVDRRNSMRINLQHPSQTLCDVHLLPPDGAIWIAFSLSSLTRFPAAASRRSDRAQVIIETAVKPFSFEDESR